jgi:hypothetical protein
MEDLRIQWQYNHHDFDNECCAAFLTTVGRILRNWESSLPLRWARMVREVAEKLGHGVIRLSFTTQCSVAEALIALRERHHSLLFLIFDDAKKRYKQFTRQEVMTLLKCSAFAPNPQSRSELNALLAGRLLLDRTLLRRCCDQAVYASWLLAMVDEAQAGHLLRGIWDWDEYFPTTAEAMQLHHTALLAQVELPRHVQQAIRIMLDEKRKTPPIPNRFENSLARTAEALVGDVVQQEFYEGYWVDVAHHKKHDLALEADGAYHHEIEVVGTRVALWGPTLLKHRLLERGGYRVPHIVDEEWGALNEERRVKLLDERIRQALVPSRF